VRGVVTKVSNTLYVPAVAQTALGAAAAALSSGSSASFTTQSLYTNPDLQWQSDWWHDTVNGVVHLMGKPAGQDSQWAHQYYRESTDSWVTVAHYLPWTAIGHIYGNSAIKTADGTFYQSRNDIDTAPAKIQRYRYGTGWDSVPTGAGDMGAGQTLVAVANGLAYHPNLYGAGDGGLILDTQFRTCFWRESNNATEQVSHSDSLYGNQYGIGVYWPAKDLCVIGGSDQKPGAGHLMLVTANGGSTPTITDAGTPPIEVAGDTDSRGSGVFGSLHVHPGNANKLLLLDTVGTNYWEGTLSGSTFIWTFKGSHPFTHQPHVVCSLRNNYGCLWMICCDEVSDTNYSTLWKPPA